ncbi:MAG: diguanylate cyclase domain-containing protein [Nitrospirota bacterium]
MTTTGSSQQTILRNIYLLLVLVAVSGVALIAVLQWYERDIERLQARYADFHATALRHADAIRLSFEDVRDLLDGHHPSMPGPPKTLSGARREIRQDADAMTALHRQYGFADADRIMDRFRGDVQALEDALRDLVDRAQPNIPVVRTHLVSASAGLSELITLHERAGEAVKRRLDAVRRTEARHQLIGIMASAFGSLILIIAILRRTHDILAQQARSEARTRTLSSAIEHSADAVMITDAHGVIQYVNPAFERVTGYAVPDVVGRTPRVLKSGEHDSAFYRLLWDALTAGRVFNGVFKNRRRSGEVYAEEKTIAPIRDGNGRITHFVSTGRDVTERLQDQERLRILATHDALTGLPNRALFVDRLEQAITRARWRKRVVATLFVDLDKFKHINDSLGHSMGDKLLREMASRLSAAVRDSDTVARFGGDEFVILLDDVACEDDIGVVAAKILDAAKPPIELGGTTFSVGASIGISVFPTDGQDPEILVKHADIAMYRAKDAGRNAYRFYSSRPLPPAAAAANS